MPDWLARVARLLALIANLEWELHAARFDRDQWMYTAAAIERDRLRMEAAYREH